MMNACMRTEYKPAVQFLQGYKTVDNSDAFEGEGGCCGKVTARYVPLVVNLLPLVFVPALQPCSNRCKMKLALSDLARLISRYSFSSQYACVK